MFPTAHSHVYYNEAGEPIGWDNYDERDQLDIEFERYERHEQDDDGEWCESHEQYDCGEEHESDIEDRLREEYQSAP